MLPKFDQTAAILVTNNYSAVDELNQRISAIQERSAQLHVELAKLKLERVRATNQALVDLGTAQDKASFWLGSAKMLMDKAETALKSQRYGEARQFSVEALQHVRQLQRNEWQAAARRMPNPTTSPWVTSYQSLPEHWKLMRQIDHAGSIDSLANLLPSGEFESLDTLLSEHWKPEPSPIETVEASAELSHVAKQGKSSLRLSANPVDAEKVPEVSAQGARHAGLARSLRACRSDGPHHRLGQSSHGAGR